MTTSTSTSTLPAPPPDALSLACLEVWGGNEPVDTALRVPGLNVWVYALPFNNQQAGGDVHFISSCGTGRIARLMVADVAGHGTQVADTARTLRDLIRRFMNHIDQRRFVKAMNQQFLKLVQAGRFATAVVMTYFSPTSQLNLCNAGHPPPLLFQKSTNTWRYLEGNPAEAETNFPLGISDDAAYEQFQITLQPGDLLLCYTDSLLEAPCRDGSLLGDDRLRQLLQQLSNSPNAAPLDPAHLIPHLLAKMSVFGATFNDDTTLLLLASTGPHHGAKLLARLKAQLKFLAQLLTFQKNIPWPEWSKRNLAGALGMQNK